MKIAPIKRHDLLRAGRERYSLCIYCELPFGACNYVLHMTIKYLHKYMPVQFLQPLCIVLHLSHVIGEHDVVVIDTLLYRNPVLWSIRSCFKYVQKIRHAEEVQQSLVERISECGQKEDDMTFEFVSRRLNKSFIHIYMYVYGQV